MKTLSLSIGALSILLALFVLSACAPIPPMQAGPYWFASLNAAGSMYPEHVEISYRVPADCSPGDAVNLAGRYCGPATRDGRIVSLIWISADLDGPGRACTLNHERAHMRGWSHAQRAPNNSAERCALGVAQ